MYSFEGMVDGLAQRLRAHKRLLAMADLAVASALAFLFLTYSGLNGRLAQSLELQGPRALIPGVAVALLTGAILSYFLARRRRRDVISLVEANYPGIREKLRTAWDNRERDSVIMRHLAEDVGALLGSVDFQGLVTYKGIALRLVVAIACISFLGGSAMVDGVDSLTDPNPRVPFVSEPESPSLDIPEYTPVEENPFGEPSMAEIEGEDLTLRLHTGYGADQMTGQGNSTDNFTDSRSHPVDVQYGGSYVDEIPAEHRDLIKTYFYGLLEEPE